MLRDVDDFSALFVLRPVRSGSNGTYLLGEKGDFFVERATAKIIQNTMEGPDGVGRDQLVMVGSSAGATGALKFGLMFGAKGILAICPHIDLDTSAELQGRMRMSRSLSPTVNR